MALEQPFTSNIHTGGNSKFSSLNATSEETKIQLALALGKKYYWTIGELETLGVVGSQLKWDRFKQSNDFTNYQIPDLVKAYLLTKKIIP